MTAVGVKPSNVGIVDLAVPQRTCSCSRTWRCLKKTSGLSFCQQPIFFFPKSRTQWILLENCWWPLFVCNWSSWLRNIQKHYYSCPIPRSIPNMKYATPCLWDCLTCPCLSQASILAYEVHPVGNLKAPTSSIDTELQLLATKPTQFVTCHHLLYAYWYCHILFGCLNGRWAANRSWGVRGRLRARYIWSQNRCFLAVLVACPANCSEDV